MIIRTTTLTTIRAGHLGHEMCRAAFLNHEIHEEHEKPALTFQSSLLNHKEHQ